MTEIFEIRGHLKGVKEVDKQLAFAPQLYSKHLRNWMYGEKHKFVGNPKKSGGPKYGTFGRSLNRKSKPYTGKKWDPRIAGNFRGRVKGRDIKREVFNLSMGVSEKDKPFLKGLRLLGSGGTIRSSKFMIIPIQQNLARSGVTANYFNNWKRMMDNRELITVRTGGRLLFLDVAGREAGLMYMGVRKVNVKKQFDFEAAWSRRIPKVMQRGQKAVDKATKQAGRIK